MASSKVEKQAVILARVASKQTSDVWYQVRASEPVEVGVKVDGLSYYNGRLYRVYRVRCVAGKAVSCNCPAYGHCYHKTGCEQAEASHKPVAQVKREVLTLLVAGLNAGYGKSVVSFGCMPAVQKTAPKREPLAGVGQRGTLNGSQSFLILRKSA